MFVLFFTDFLCAILSIFVISTHSTLKATDSETVRPVAVAEHRGIVTEEKQCHHPVCRLGIEA